MHNPSLNNRYPLYWRNPQVSTTRDEEGFVATIDQPGQACVVRLNTTGEAIWTLLDKPMGIHDLLVKLQAMYAVDPIQCRIKLLEFLDQATAQRIILQTSN